MANSLSRITMSAKQQYSNPTGKGSSHVAARHVISAGMKQKYASLLRQYRREFKVWVYKYPNRDILFHINVPSQDYAHNKIRYDTIIHIPFGETPQIQATKLDEKPAYFWTNSPSFTFTYAWVYKERGILYRELDNKLPTEALTREPIIRNPDKSTGYDYGVWQALAYLYTLNAFDSRVVESLSTPANEFNQIILKRRINDVATLLSINKLVQYEKAKPHRKEMDSKEKVLSKTRQENYNRNQQKFGKLIKPKKSLGAIQARKAIKKITSTRKH